MGLYNIFEASKNIIKKLDIKENNDKPRNYWENSKEQVSLSHYVKLPQGEITIVTPDGKETKIMSNSEEYDEEELFYETLNSDRNRLLKWQ